MCLATLLSAFDFQEDIAAGTYTLFDVVLPLPGKTVSYPQNVMREHYKDALARDGIDIENPWVRLAEFSGSLNGTYRSIVKHVGNMKTEMVPPLDGKDGSLDMVLSFDLGKGEYATMALWELMKQRPLEKKGDEEPSQ